MTTTARKTCFRCESQPKQSQHVCPAWVDWQCNCCIGCEDACRRERERADLALAEEKSRLTNEPLPY